MVKSRKNKCSKIHFPKSEGDTEVEHDACPKNGKSREIFRGQRQEQPQAKVGKGRFSMKRCTFEITGRGFLEIYFTKIVNSIVIGTGTTAAIQIDEFSQN